MVELTIPGKFLSLRSPVHMLLILAWQRFELKYFLEQIYIHFELVDTKPLVGHVIVAAAIITIYYLMEQVGKTYFYGYCCWGCC